MSIHSIVCKHSVCYGNLADAAGGVSTRRMAAWNRQQWTPLGSGVSGQVASLAVDNNGMLYVGGYHFTTAGGVTANCITVWGDTDGDGDTEWAALGTGTPHAVLALAVDGRDNVMIAGAFTGMDGKAASRIVQWTVAP